MQHFVYMWFDRARKMFYVGSHSGSVDDGYVSSSRWLSGEVRYRPADFKRRVIKFFDTKHEAQIYEGYLLTLIQPLEFGTKYYNMKQGKPSGTPSWNSGKTGVYTEETLQKMSNKKLGNRSNTGKSMPRSAENGKKGAAKLSAAVTGRKKFLKPNGTWTWVYPEKSAS